MKTFVYCTLLMLSIVINSQATPPEDNRLEYDADKLGLEVADYSLFDRYNVPNNSFGRRNNYNFSFIANNRRGYDLTYNQIYIDNLLLNDAVSGRALWSMLSLLRKSEGVDFADRYGIDRCWSSNPFSYGENYVVEPGLLDQYSSRVWLKTGTTEKGSGIGFATNGAIGQNWKYSGFVDMSVGKNSYTPSVGGYDVRFSLSAQRMFKNNKRLIIAIFFDMDSTALRLPTTRSAMELRGDNLYNPSWGWLGGKRRNSRTKTETTLVPVIKYAGQVSKSSEITVALSGVIKSTKRSALAWFDALDPRPDYYRYMPGFIGNGYLDDQAIQSWVDNSQIDWMELYGANIGNGSAKYIIEDRHENITNAQIAVSMVTRLDQRLTLGYGIRGRIQATNYFKTINDLLGATGMYDIDRYLIDNELYGNKLHNNVRDKDRFLTSGDKFGYNYRLTAQNTEAFAELRYDSHPLLLKLNALAGNVGYCRVGKFEKELFEGDLSYGKSKQVSFNTMSIAAQMTYKPAVHHVIELKAMYSSGAPAATSLFTSPQYRNEIVNNPHNVNMSGGEVRYGYIGKRFNVSLCGYYTAIGNETDVYSYYDDLEREYCDMYMYNIAQRHYGAEISAEITISTPLSLECSAVVGSHKYSGNPQANIKRNTDGKSVVEAYSVDLDGFNVGNVAGGLLSAGIKYNRNLWIASLNANVATDRYVEPSPLRRMSRIYTLVRGDDMFRNFVAQEKLPKAIRVNLFLQKTFRVGKNSNYITIYTSINNIFGYKDNIFSAYEPMRVRRSAVGTVEKYTPMENTYLYSNARSFHIGASFKLKY